MQKIFFTADTHFGHENVIQFDKRPFASADEMDEEMIKRWNNKVVYDTDDFPKENIDAVPVLCKENSNTDRQYRGKS